MEAPAGGLVPVGAVTLLAVAAGVAITASPRPALILLPVSLLTWLLVVRSAERVERLLTFVLVGGAIVLGYGFANVGIKSGFAPIPLAEILLIPLVVAAVMGRPEWRLPSRFAVPVVVYVGIVGARLLFDYPVWHSLAIRDATTGVELLTVYVGYRALSRDGIQPWVRRFELMFIAMLVLGTLYQFSWLEAHSPMVGLQKPVALLGARSLNDGAVVAAFAFFALYSKGMRRTVLMAWALALAAVAQERGLYIALVLAVIVLGTSMRRGTTTLTRVFTALGLAVVLLVLAAGMGISGRLGKLSPDFYVKHVETLDGAQGPGSGSFADRVRWTHDTLHLMGASAKTEIFGVGLGPDLAFGFKDASGDSPRKPHDDYLEVLARTGVVGFAVFAFMLVSLLSPIVRTRNGLDSETATFRAFVLAGAGAFLAIAATQPLLAYPYGTIPTFLLLGMGLAAVRKPHARALTGAAD